MMDDTITPDGPAPPANNDLFLGAFVAEFPSAMAMFDRNMRYVMWSRQWAERYGLGDRDLTGICQYDLFPDLPWHFIEAHQRALSGKDVPTEEGQVRHEDGRLGWERWHIKAIRDPSGDVVGLSILVEDITDRKRAEAHLVECETRLRLVTDTLGIGIIETDYKSGASAVSHSFQRMTGLRQENLPLDLNDWIKALNASDPKAFRQAARRALDPGGDGFFSAELQPEVMGRKSELQLVGRVLFDGNSGNRMPSRFVGVLIDQTERNALQGSLAQTQRLEAIGRISGIIAHDSNNLLSVILANLELAAMRVSDDVVREHLEIAMDAAEMGAGFNKKLLALSGRRYPQPALVPIDEHILNTWAILERLLNERISLRFAPDAEQHCVRIDPSELDGAILNLVVNARDAQPEGGEITIATRRMEMTAETAATFENGRTGDFVELSVSDKGIGMTPEEVTSAKDPFVSSKAPEMGTGLGLTSVAATMDRVNGFFSIASEKGKGTKVSLYLPVAEGAVSRQARQEETPFGDGQLVLVVEDDDQVREATLKRLEALGYAVIEASDGETALRLLAEGEPVDLVFSDVVLPGKITGYDIAEHVQRAHPNSAILLTSGHLSRRNGPRRAEGELPELVKKPYTLSVLARAVERALSHHGTPEQHPR